MASDIDSSQTNTLPQLIIEKIRTQIINKEQQDMVEILLKHIQKNKGKTNDELFIISAAYDAIYKKYNKISLAILILSAFVTLIEAFRLSILEFINNNPDILINIYIISFTMNILTLSIGTVITVLSSIIRFKNYRETLEQLKDKQNLIIGYKEKYSKKYEKILNLLAFNKLTKEELTSIYERVIEYDNDIKKVNILEYIRNDDFIKYNKYKAYFDVTMFKIDADKDMALRSYSKYCNDSIQAISNSNENKKSQNSEQNDESQTEQKMQFLKIKKMKEYFFNKQDITTTPLVNQEISAKIGFRN